MLRLLLREQFDQGLQFLLVQFCPDTYDVDIIAEMLTYSYSFCFQDKTKAYLARSAEVTGT